MILDNLFGAIADARALASALDARAGIFEDSLLPRRVAGGAGRRHVRHGAPMETSR